MPPTLGLAVIFDFFKIAKNLVFLGIYRLGHQKRLLLAIKRAKDLKSGRRIAQYPTSAAAAACAQAAAAATSMSNHHPVAPKNIVRPSPPPASNYGSIGGGGMNSFQSLPPAAPAQRTPTKVTFKYYVSKQGGWVRPNSYFC